jgi:hypothetical protein
MVTLVAIGGGLFSPVVPIPIGVRKLRHRNSGTQELHVNMKRTKDAEDRTKKQHSPVQVLHRPPHPNKVVSLPCSHVTTRRID